MGNDMRELEPVDDEPNKKKGLDEGDLAMQRIYTFNSAQHKLKDATCSICLIDITDSQEDEAGSSDVNVESQRIPGVTMVCELTCGHSFHAPCVLGWLTHQSHCCPNCRKDLRVNTKV